MYTVNFSASMGAYQFFAWHLRDMLTMVRVDINGPRQHAAPQGPARNVPKPTWDVPGATKVCSPRSPPRQKSRHMSTVNASLSSIKYR